MEEKPEALEQKNQALQDAKIGVIRRAKQDCSASKSGAKTESSCLSAGRNGIGTADK